MGDEAFGALREALSRAPLPPWHTVLDLWAAAEPDAHTTGRYAPYLAAHVTPDALGPLLLWWGRLRDHELAARMVDHWRQTRPEQDHEHHALLPDPPAHTAAHVRALLDAALAQGCADTTVASARLWRALWAMPLTEDEARTRWRGGWHPEAQVALGTHIVRVLLTWDDPDHDPSRAVIGALFGMPYLADDPEELSAWLARDPDALPWIIAYHLLAHHSMRPLGLRFTDPEDALTWLLTLTPTTTRQAAHFLHDILNHSEDVDQPHVQRALHVLWHDHMGATDAFIDYTNLADCWPADTPAWSDG